MVSSGGCDVFKVLSFLEDQRETFTQKPGPGFVVRIVKIAGTVGRFEGCELVEENIALFSQCFQSIAGGCRAVHEDVFASCVNENKRAGQSTENERNPRADGRIERQSAQCKFEGFSRLGFFANGSKKFHIGSQATKSGTGAYFKARRDDFEIIQTRYFCVLRLQRCDNFDVVRGVIHGLFIDKFGGVDGHGKSNLEGYGLLRNQNALPKYDAVNDAGLAGTGNVDSLGFGWQFQGQSALKLRIGEQRNVDCVRAIYAECPELGEDHVIFPGLDDR